VMPLRRFVGSETGTSIMTPDLGRPSWYLAVAPFSFSSLSRMPASLVDILLGLCVGIKMEGGRIVDGVGVGWAWRRCVSLAWVDDDGEGLIKACSVDIGAEVVYM